MPLQKPEPPGAVSEISRQELERLRSAVPPDERERTQFSLGDAYPVYRGSLRAFAEGKGLDTAALGAWRQLISVEQAPIAMMEVSMGKDGNSFRFSSINHGPFVEATARALTIAEHSSRIQEGAFELRLLQVPALYLLAIWLKNTEDSRETLVAVEDTLVPVAPAPDNLIANREYLGREFEQALQEVARTRLAQSDETKGA